jgi:hypothetical protein
MKKIIDYIKKNGWQAATIILALLYISKGCTSSKIATVSEKIDDNAKRIELLEKKVVGTHEVDSIVNENMWKFLEVEELSDKNNIPVNALKRKENN